VGKVKLSVCIPTYNFGAFIGETLESIARQDLTGIEIIILDSASTDNTPEIVAIYRKRLPCVRYIRTERKGGIDRDMARVIENAAGEYVWLFSADDIMHPGAASTVANELLHGCDVFLCSHTMCDGELRFLFNHPVIHARPGATFDLKNIGQRHEYFTRAANTEAFFSFMSGVIVKVQTWRSVPMNEKFVGSCWAHVARLFEVIVRHGLTVRYIGGPLIDRRGDNDSFKTGSMADRWCLSIKGFSKIVAEYFGACSLEAKHVKRVLQVEFTLLSFISLRARLKGLDREVALTDELFLTLYGQGAAGSRWKWFAYRAFALIPASFLKGLVRVMEITGAKGALNRVIRSLSQSGDRS
jgi:abequosyltransferase